MHSRHTLQRLIVKTLAKVSCARYSPHHAQSKSPVFCQVGFVQNRLNTYPAKAGSNPLNQWAMMSHSRGGEAE